MSENSLLDMVPLFNNLEPEQRNWLSGYFLHCQFPVGSKIFAQDAPAEYFYVLVAGEVQVRFKPYDGPELTVSHVQPGEVFGWSAALGNAIYTASAISIGECQLLRMRGADLHKICRESPKNGARILEILASATGGRYNNAYSQVVALLEYGMCNSVEARRNNHGNSI